MKTVAWNGTGSDPKAKMEGYVSLPFSVSSVSLW